MIERFNQRVRAGLAFVQRDVETPKSKANIKRTLDLAAKAMTFISITMSVLNFFNHREAMLCSTLLLAFVFSLTGLLCRYFYNEKLIKLIITITVGAVFSYYVLVGGNNGFALLWTVLVPFAYMALLDFAYGIFLGFYFWVFLMLLFWTPCRVLLQYRYNADTLLRYPIFYLCGLVLAVIIGLNEKRLRIIELENDRKLQEAVLAERRRVVRLSVDAISSICHALDAKDAYTGQHSENVAFYTEKMVGRLHWSPEKTEAIVRAAKLHDIGKIGIPDAIINKKGPLTEDEYAQMKRHVTLGAQILSDFTTMPEVVVGAKYHHERYDGTGYAEGLSGEAIPIEGRIIAIADSIDAMYSTRSYYAKTTKTYVKEELEKGKGKQFDPALVEIAIRLIDEGMLEQLDAM